MIKLSKFQEKVIADMRKTGFVLGNRYGAGPAIYELLASGKYKHIYTVPIPTVSALLDKKVIFGKYLTHDNYRHLYYYIKDNK